MAPKEKRALYGPAAHADEVGELPGPFPRTMGPNCAKYVQEVVDAGLLCDMATRFEKAFAEELGVKHCVATPGCTPALAVLAAAFGFELVVPANVYQRSERSAKYGILFIAVTFLGFFVFETVAGARLHPIQYLFVGIGLCCFYLVLLALSEHVGFAMAYLLADMALIAIIGGYCSAIMGHRRYGLMVGSLMGLIYLLLYWLVISEAYSLLVGSIFLLVLLGLAMYLTRNIDWYNVNSKELSVKTDP